MSKPIDSQQALLNFHAEMSERCRALMQAKNTDYAKDAVFGNLDACDQLGICSTEMGILVRMLDKIKRLVNTLDAEAMVKDENLQDSCDDLLNYAVLLAAKIHTRKCSPSVVENAPPTQ